MSDTGQPPGQSSWAALLGGNLPTRNDNNVMEIILEKDERGVFNVSEEEVAKALHKLGADLRPGVHMQGVQICPMGRNVIQVTLNKNVDIERFCNKEVFELKQGMRISQVRQAGKKEVVLTIKGLHPNTKDETVFKYLKCIGKIEKKKVIMDTFKSGPLTGLQNGNRMYTVEIRQDIGVGPTHFIDGHKVNINFRGQKRFCFRCYKVDRECVGKGMAKDCAAIGGPRVLFSDYITQFWNKVKFSPDENILPSELNESELEVQIGGNFTPRQAMPKTGLNIQNQNSFGAVSVKWFPKQSDPGDIKTFLVDLGLPPDHEHLNIKDNGQVIIDNLTSEMCQELATSISGKRFKDKKMSYCQPIVLATTEKASSSAPAPACTAPNTTGSATPA